MQISRDNKFAFLDFASVTKEGIADALEEVLAVSRSIKAKRIVIDSLSAIILAFDNILELPSTEVLENARAGGLDVKLFSFLTGL